MSSASAGRSDHLAGVVLAAGEGRRLAPLTRLRAKAMCPVGRRALVDHGLDRLAVAGIAPTASAVNLRHRAAMLDAHLPQAVHRSFEHPIALGTAGAIGALRPWLDGRDVLVTNSDAWFGDGQDLAAFVDGWDRERFRLLTVVDADRGDFGDLRYCGVTLLPGAAAASLRAEPTGLYEVLWRLAAARGQLDLVTTDATFVDCGTPQDYLRANLLSSGGESVVDETAVVMPSATVERSVVWDHAEVRAGERLVDAIRTAETTVLVR